MSTNSNKTEVKKTTTDAPKKVVVKKPAVKTAPIQKTVVTKAPEKTPVQAKVVAKKTTHMKTAVVNKKPIDKKTTVAGVVKTLMDKAPVIKKPVTGVVKPVTPKSFNKASSSPITVSAPVKVTTKPMASRSASEDKMRPISYSELMAKMVANMTTVGSR